IVGATVAGVSTGVDAVARRAQDNSMFAGANYKGNSVYGRNAAAARGSSLGRSLGRLRGLLGVASKASGVIGIIATAGSLIGEADCRAKCKDPCDDSSRYL